MNVNKTLPIMLLLVLTTGFLSAQVNDPKYYSDYQKDFRGYALAIYMTEDEKSIVTDNMSDLGDPVRKMTRSNKWLCEKALNEWDTEPGEYYLIVCLDNPYSDEGLLVLATIEEDGKSFDWWARTVTEEDFDSL